MAYDKAVDSAQLDAGLTTIADAIRAKGGTTEPLDFPQGMADAVAAISGASSDDTPLESVLSGAVKILKSEKATVVASNTLIRAPALTTIELPKVRTVNVYSFQECKKLSTVIMPSVKLINDKAFSGSPLENVDFSSLEDVRWQVFYGAKFTKLDLPNLLYINNNQSFQHADNLVALIIRTPKLCQLGNINNFADMPISKGTGYIYVPKVLVEQYKTATNWVTYAAQIRAIEDYPEITGGAK